MPLISGLASLFSITTKSSGLNATQHDSLGALSPSQSRAVLITGLVSGTISLLAALLALRWFALMKKSFRHKLVMYLIISDTFKAIWYFIFPIVVFAKGEIKSGSKFCHASGFLLAFSIESSDFAILIIALHSILYIFKPPTRLGEGGLYPYRYLIYPVWLGVPLMMASLAFTNHHGAYVTSGTYCYLPKRPFWYRLALSWIPRYVIITAILVMYGALYVYVHIKFKGFSNLGQGGTSYSSSSESHDTSMVEDSKEATPIQSPPRVKRAPGSQSSRVPTYRNTIQIPAKREPWDNMSFITSKHLQDASHSKKGVSTSDFASREFGSASTDDTKVDGRRGSILPNNKSRRQSEVPTLGTTFTAETVATVASTESNADEEMAFPLSHLDATRLAIRRQLRYLFIYPLVYVLMWTFPFVFHCMQYSDYYTAHPIFWLSLVNTISVSLQAGADSIVFSWREKPWRKIDSQHVFSIPFLYNKCRTLLGLPEKRVCGMESQERLESVNPTTQASSHWWEAESRARNESVWRGEDIVSHIASRMARPSIFRHFTHNDAAARNRGVSV